MENTLTPPAPNKAVTMSFYDALKQISTGKRVKRISWANHDYCAMDNEWLAIFKEGKPFSWCINDGDMEGQDYIIVTELN